MEGEEGEREEGEGEGEGEGEEGRCSGKSISLRNVPMLYKFLC